MWIVDNMLELVFELIDRGWDYYEYDDGTIYFVLGNQERWVETQTEAAEALDEIRRYW